MDENKDVHDDEKDRNEGLTDPGRRERRRPEAPWLEPSFIDENYRIEILKRICNSGCNYDAWIH